MFLRYNFNNNNILSVWSARATDILVGRDLYRPADYNIVDFGRVAGTFHLEHPTFAESFSGNDWHGLEITICFIDKVGFNEFQF